MKPRLIYMPVIGIGDTISPQKIIDERGYEIGTVGIRYAPFVIKALNLYDPLIEEHYEHHCNCVYRIAPKENCTWCLTEKIIQANSVIAYKHRRRKGRI